jgi:hypothetical protein
MAQAKINPWRRKYFLGNCYFTLRTSQQSLKYQSMAHVEIRFTLELDGFLF